ncbi:hypothetical protein CKAH01_12084 [Colletotrichum kahawae]|uniref:Uncharacterized protein n=1 Tax=Colletotrichum kahawae TaxID=34407 RepID=A0AAE0DD53_COLKA|nr:hypothetical protein CKAH01_12084 [Colletotrichum kahawae]
MDSPGLLQYRTAKLRIQRTDNVTLSTEGRELLYVTSHGFIGGTGLISAYLMQQDMTDERAQIAHYSAKPICNHAWNFQTRAGSFQMIFTSQWQEFAQLHSYVSCEGLRYMATTSFPRTPGEVIVQMFPSGRVIGRAAQTWFSHRNSPILCSIDTAVNEHEQIVIFKPQNKRLAPVLSQALPIIMATPLVESPTPPNTCPLNKFDSPAWASPEEASWMGSNEDHAQEPMPCLTTTNDGSCEACTIAGSRDLHDYIDSPAEAIEQQHDRRPKSSTRQDGYRHNLNITVAPLERHTGIGHMESSPCREDAEDDLCIVARPWQ